MGKSEVAKRISLKIVGGLSPSQRKAFEPIFYGDKAVFPSVRNVIRTDCPNIDVISARSVDGKWGLPCGRLVYIQGRDKVGKTTLCLHIMKWVQEHHGVVYMIESEHSLDISLAQRIGVDPDRIIFSMPRTMEECAAKIRSAVKMIMKVRDGNDEEIDTMNDIPILIVVDSVSALPTEAEVKDDFSKAHPGEHARIISKLCREVTGVIGRLNIMLLFVFQERRKIGGSSWGDNSTFIGGDAVRFHASVGFKISRIAFLKDNNDERIGIRSKVQNVLNKCRKPFGSAEIDIYWGKGIDTKMTLWDALMDNGIVVGTGSKKGYVAKFSSGKKIEIKDYAFFENVVSSFAKRLLLMRELNARKNII